MYVYGIPPDQVMFHLAASLSLRQLSKLKQELGLLVTA